MDVTASFKHFDGGAKGFLDRGEAKLAFISVLGYKPSKFELNSLFTEEEVSLPAFNRVMSARLRHVDPTDRVRDTFRAFDISRTGYLTLEDLHAALAAVKSSSGGGGGSLALPVQTISEMFEEADQDCDGRISFRDFEASAMQQLQQR